jgi:hypothetical protein
MTQTNWPYPWPQNDIATYTARRVNTPPTIDGNLNKPCWQQAPRSPSFRDLISGETTPYDTRAAVLWDDQFLYIGYWIEEPDVRAHLTERDAPIYEDNDVEFFIAGQDAYYEFEINALGTIYEVFFIWEDAYERAGYHLKPEFKRDAVGVRPFDGVGFKHPRGQRIGYWNFDLNGLQSAVNIQGTLNDSSDKDTGWTVELAIPWKSLWALADGRSLPPEDGDIWRMDFSRFNQYKTSEKDSAGWVWSPHGVWDSHVPELFTKVQFSTKLVTELARTS